MSQELHYTSVPRGLKPGSRGFCTVALTPHMPGQLVDRLEGLSGYQPVFSPDDPSAALNPIVFSHVRLTVSGKLISVLSRIGPAGLDYSGRPNKYAHHVVLDGNERPDGGPAWLLKQPDFVQAVWTGEPREIPSGRVPPLGDRKAGAAHNWQALTGDGGWAGVLAEAFQNDPKRPVFLTIRPGLDLLPLFVEAVALLPASRRWEVDFSTYFNQLPQGVSCAWRGVLEGSEEAKNARRLPNAIFIDLCQRVGRAEGGALVHLARTGEQLQTVPGVSPSSFEPARQPAATGRESRALHTGAPPQAAPPRAPSQAGNYELVPELARLAAKGRSGSEVDGVDRARPKKSRLLGTLLATGCIVLLVALGLFFLAPGSIKMLGVDAEISKEISAEREVISELNRKAEEADLAAQKEATRKKAEEIEAAKVELVKKDARESPAVTPLPRPPADPNPTRSVPSIAILPKEETKDIEPAVEFFELPPVHVSGVGRTPSKPSEFTLKEGFSFNPVPFYMNAFELRPLESKAGFEIWERTASQVGHSLFAKIRKEKEKVLFEWTDQAKDRKVMAESLRDGVLRLSGSDRECYVLFRNPVTGVNQPFDLANKRGNPEFRRLRIDDYQPRIRSFQWAKEDPLKGTNWMLGIRGWKLVCIGDGANEVISVGAPTKSEWLQSVKTQIIPEKGKGDPEVELKIEIDPHEKRHLVTVTIEFNKIQILKKTSEREATLDEFGALAKKKKPEPEDVERLNELMEVKTTIDHIKSLYRALATSTKSTLSLVVSLKLNEDSIYLDIAKFGEITTH